MATSGGVLTSLQCGYNFHLHWRSPCCWPRRTLPTPFCSDSACSFQPLYVYNLMQWRAHNERDWHKCALNAHGTGRQAQHFTDRLTDSHLGRTVCTARQQLDLLGIGNMVSATGRGPEAVAWSAGWPRGTVVASICLFTSHIGVWRARFCCLGVCFVHFNRVYYVPLQNVDGRSKCGGYGRPLVAGRHSKKS